MVMNEKNIAPSAIRPRGRPKTDRQTCNFTLMLDLAMKDQIDRLAVVCRLTRGEIMRRALERGLADLPVRNLKTR
jgi:hypothetical protein